MEITQPTWYIAHNGIDVFHRGYIVEGRITTGQPFLETFLVKQTGINRLIELGSPVIDFPEEVEQ
jgi:hypothetical protein